MKIEKLTDNKIRIIVNLDDLKEKNIDSKALIDKPAETQNLILDILVQNKKSHDVWRQVGIRNKKIKLNYKKELFIAKIS